MTESRRRSIIYTAQFISSMLREDTKDVRWKRFRFTLRYIMVPLKPGLEILVKQTSNSRRQNQLVLVIS